MKTLLLLIFTFISISAYGQNDTLRESEIIDKNSKATSDFYFRRGMDLCDKGKYKEAISCFELSKSHLSKSNVNQKYHGYDDIWIEYCKFILSDKDEGKGNVEYNNKPFNRFEYNSADSLLCIIDKLVDRNEIEEACRKMIECINHVTSIGNNPLLWINWRLSDFVNLLIDKEYYEDAISFSQVLLKVRQALYEDNNEDLINAYLVLFQLYKEINDFSHAIEYGQTIIELLKENPNNYPDIYPSVVAGMAFCMSKDNVESYSYRIRDYINEMRNSSEAVKRSDIESYSGMYLDAVRAAENIKDYELAYDICDNLIPFLRANYSFSDDIRDNYYYVLDFLASYYQINQKNLLEQISLEEMKKVANNNSDLWYLTAVTKLFDVYCRNEEYEKASELYNLSKEKLVDFIEQSSKSAKYDDIAQAGLLSYRLAWYFFLLGKDNEALKSGKDAFSNLEKVFGIDNRYTLLAGTDLLGYYIKMGYWQDAKEHGLKLANNIKKDTVNYKDFMPKISRYLNNIVNYE